MDNYAEIILPFSFNPLKHHLGYIHRFISSSRADRESRLNSIIQDIKRVGSSVTDIYMGSLSPMEITTQAGEFFSSHGIHSMNDFIGYTGNGKSDYKLISLHDTSSWVVKPLAGPDRYIHIFPSKGSVFTTREKGNSVKIAILMSVFSLDSHCTLKQLDNIRNMAGLPPVKSLNEASAIFRFLERLPG